MINEFIEAFKGYVEYLKNVMLNGGIIFMVGILLIFLPLSFFIHKHWIILAIIWFLLSDPFIAGFLVYYLTDYKELKGGK